jgi:hypothetical protein
MSRANLTSKHRMIRSSCVFDKYVLSVPMNAATTAPLISAMIAVVKGSKGVKVNVPLRIPSEAATVTRLTASLPNACINTRRGSPRDDRRREEPVIEVRTHAGSAAGLRKRPYRGGRICLEDEKPVRAGCGG